MRHPTLFDHEYQHLSRVVFERLFSFCLLLLLAIISTCRSMCFSECLRRDVDVCKENICFFSRNLYIPDDLIIDLIVASCIFIRMAPKSNKNETYLRMQTFEVYLNQLENVKLFFNDHGSLNKVALF